MIANLRRLIVSPKANLDLVAAWLATVAAHTLVPADHVLARGDLVPWTTVCMTLVAALRALPLGDSPHPSLTVRHAPWARTGGRIGLVLSPLALFLTYEALGGRQPLPYDIDVRIAAVVVWLVVAALRAIGEADRRTAWDPPGLSTLRWWAIRGALVLWITFHLGTSSASEPTAPDWTAAGLLGVQFLLLGMLPDSVQALRQRRAAGRRDGRPYQPPMFRFVLATLGPSFGLELLIGMHHLLDMPVGFAQSTVVSLHVFAWAAVIWPPLVPVARSCILHEVVPAGGGDPGLKGNVSFEWPPEGALRLNPLAVRRVGQLHHWVVPVQDPRIEGYDDPIRLLWSRPTLPLPYHVLGEATFEPDEATQLPQWDTITIRLDEQRDVGRLSQNNVQTRRLSVLRPFPKRRMGLPRILRTYRWEPEIPPGALQVVDATTEQITLQSGDLIVLSSEGVARALELELGAPIYAHEELAHRRGPHLEDYVELP